MSKQTTLKELLKALEGESVKVQVYTGYDLVLTPADRRFAKAFAAGMNIVFPDSLVSSFKTLGWLESEQPVTLREDVRKVLEELYRLNPEEPG